MRRRRRPFGLSIKLPALGVIELLWDAFLPVDCLNILQLFLELLQFLQNFLNAVGASLMFLLVGAVEEDRHWLALLILVVLEQVGECLLKRRFHFFHRYI